ncbi:MAG: ATP-binding cassette domain-containing protein [Sneathiella sp.]|nr:ATP-binding cassette domain-containing protein [Sneathiella sp.]
MRELWLRLQSYPFVSTQLIVASLFANLLALATPVFVIMVLNRYIGSGIDATLITLTSGVVLAILLEFCFRFMRLKLTEKINTKRNHDLMIGAFGMVLSAKMRALAEQSAGEKRETLQGLQIIEAAYAPSNLTTLFDFPFALVFVSVLFLLAPVLGIVVLCFLCASLGISYVDRHLSQENIKTLSKTNASGNSLISTADLASKTVRAFNLQNVVMKKWGQYVSSFLSQRRRSGHQQGTVQALMGMVQALMSVSIYAIGALLVVKGELDIGSLIGANILASRAFGPITQLSRLQSLFSKAKIALARIHVLAQIETEKDKGTSPKVYKGGLKFKDVSFSYPGSTIPLFESLDLTITPGSILILVGESGTGKSTFFHMVTGLLEPDRGQVLTDGIEMQQLSLPWWRQQLIYLPQEPLFLSASILENMDNRSPLLVENALRQAGLEEFIDNSAKGLETVLHNNGLNLPVGIRRRLALARAFLNDGALVLCDDPTEGLDIEGRKIVLQCLKNLSEQGKTLIIATNDPAILRGASVVLDLNQKPAPQIRKMVSQ